MDEVRSNEFDEERRKDVGEKDDAFGESADEVLGGGEDNDVEDVVDKACMESASRNSGSRDCASVQKSIPRNQNATTTRMSGW